MPTRFRIAIVGCGTIGKTHAEAITYLADAELAAVADTFEETPENLPRNMDVAFIPITG